MKLSIVILNWNGKHLLRRYMPSVIAAAKYVKGKHEIIVVDDGSTDGSVQFLKSKFPKVKVIPLKENMGISQASNIGAKRALGDILVLLNNDIVLKRDSLKHVLSHFKNPKVFAVSPKVLYWGKKTIQSEFLGCSFILGTVVVVNPKLDKIDTQEFKEHCLTFFATGGASAFDKKKFLELGGFDELYRPYWGDVDLSYRAYKRGWVCVYEPRDVFYHKHSATLSKAFSREALHVQELKTRFIFTWSNFYDPKIILKHFLFLPLVFLRSAFISSYRTSRFLDVKAFFQALRCWRRIMKKRAREKKHAKLSDKEALDLINSNQANKIASISFRNFLFKK